MLNIYYGRENLDKEKFIFSSLDLKGRAMILVPDQFTLDMETALFKETGAAALMDIEVISMSRLGYRILNETGGSRQSFIDKYGRHMILTDICLNEKDNLKVYRGLERKNSFIEMANNFISEMKQYNCGINELSQIIEGLPESSYTRKKLEDLRLLYSKYEEKISGKYTDSEDYIDFYTKKISQSKLVNENDIWVYGFDSFAPKAISVLGELMSYANSVNVVLTCSENPKTERDRELFSLTEIVMNNLELEASARGIEAYRYPILGAEIKKSPEIAHLEHELYAFPSQKFDGKMNPEAIEIRACANLYSEAESAASYVLHLIRDKGYRLNEIRIISNDTDIRNPILIRTFKEYGIDLFSDAERDIMGEPEVKYIISQLDAVNGKFKGNSVISCIKSHICDLTDEQIFDLENYAIKYGIKGNKWKSHFTKGEFEYGAEKLGEIDRLRETVMAKIEEFSNLFKAEKMRDFAENLYSYTESNISETDENGDNNRIREAILSVIEQLKEILGETKFDSEEFTDLLKTGISQIKIGMLPPTKDGLVMGTLQRTRLDNVRALVVCGANEGILPSGGYKQGLFGQDEKELFSSRGIELLKSDTIKLLEERLAIYRNLTKPTERLYISYSIGDAEGKPARESGIITRIKEIFPEIKVKKDVLNTNIAEQLVNGEMSGFRHFIDEVQKTAEGAELDDIWGEVMSWYNRNRPELIDNMIKGLSFDNYVEKLGNEAAKELYTKDGIFSLSPTRIEHFSKCPFEYLINYGLRPEERRVYQAAGREIGELCHEAIMVFTEKMSDKNLWKTVSEEECRKMVREIIDVQSRKYRDGLFESGNEENYRKSRLIDICEKSCIALVEQVRCGEIEKSSFEVSFGRWGSIPAVEIVLDEKTGEKAFVEGRIDRVDLIPNNRVKIIDYKTGNEKFNIEEARQGYKLQLMLYMRAARGTEAEYKPAGVFYFHIDDPRIDSKTLKPEISEISSEIRKSFRMNGLLIDEERTIENIAGNILPAGRSEVVEISRLKDGTIKGEKTLISEEKFGELEQEIEKKVTEIVKALSDGHAEVHPMKTKNESACTYCSFHSICKFDTSFDKNKWNVIDV